MALIRRGLVRALRGGDDDTYRSITSWSPTLLTPGRRRTHGRSCMNASAPGSSNETKPRTRSSATTSSRRIATARSSTPAIRLSSASRSAQVVCWLRPGLARGSERMPGRLPTSSAVARRCFRLASLSGRRSYCETGSHWASWVTRPLRMPRSARRSMKARRRRR